jgi:hypothetical protein
LPDEIKKATANEHLAFTSGSQILGLPNLYKKVLFMLYNTFEYIVAEEQEFV